MKKFLFLSLLTAFSAQAMEIELNCGNSLSDGSVKVGHQPQTIGTDGKNSAYFPIQFGADANNSVLVSLNPSSKICADLECKTYKGQVYTLSMVRYENPIRKASQLQAGHKEKVKGDTSATMEITLMDNGEMKVDYLKNGAYIYDANAVPEGMEINYTVSRGFLKQRQDISFSCRLQVNK